MDVLTWINTILLGGVIVFGWLKLANGDESEGCCAIILLCLFLALGAIGGLTWFAGSLIGWW